MAKLIEAHTPTRYEGQYPPYLNISEAGTPYEEVVVTVRGGCKPDGSMGETASIKMTKRKLHEILLRAARRLGWLPMTEEQWMRDYYLRNPEEAKKARERIEELKNLIAASKRAAEEATAELEQYTVAP